MSGFFNSKYTALKLKLMAKVFGPFLGAGIRITKVAADLRYMETRLKVRWYNKNVVGTHYGGSLFSMADPFYMLMLMANIGDKHIVWDKTSTIEFLTPVKSEVRAEFKLTENKIDHIVNEAKDGKPHYVNFEVKIMSAENELVAKVHKTLYVRRKPEKR